MCYSVYVLACCCHGCRGRFDPIHGHPKAGLCALWVPALASPRTILAIAGHTPFVWAGCSEKPPTPDDEAQGGYTDPLLTRPRHSESSIAGGE